MFVRTKVFRNKDGSTRTYLQLVTSERVGNRVRQRVVANLGRLDEPQAGPLDRLIEHLARFSRRQWILEKARQIEAKQAKTWGPVLIFCVFHRIRPEFYLMSTTIPSDADQRYT
jgi:hypothetical protein